MLSFIHHNNTSSLCALSLGSCVLLQEFVILFILKLQLSNKIFS